MSWFVSSPHIPIYEPETFEEIYVVRPNGDKIPVCSQAVAEANVGYHAREYGEVCTIERKTVTLNIQVGVI